MWIQSEWVSECVYKYMFKVNDVAIYVRLIVILIFHKSIACMSHCLHIKWSIWHAPTFGQIFIILQYQNLLIWGINVLSYRQRWKIEYLYFNILCKNVDYKLPEVLNDERDVTGAEAFRFPLRWNEEEPPSSLKEESGVPALNDERPIAELLAVLSRT